MVGLVFCFVVCVVLDLFVLLVGVWFVVSVRWGVVLMFEVLSIFIGWQVVSSR